jgi:hypothetical protein
MHGKAFDTILYFYQLIDLFFFDSPKRGPSRPFNFFGYLTSSTMDRLANAVMKPSNHTFVVRKRKNNKQMGVLRQSGNAYENDKTTNLFFIIIISF